MSLMLRSRLSSRCLRILSGYLLVSCSLALVLPCLFCSLTPPLACQRVNQTQWRFLSTGTIPPFVDGATVDAATGDAAPKETPIWLGVGRMPLLPATCYMLHAACRLLPVVCCLLSAACCLLPAACCLLPAACCLLPAASYLLPAACMCTWRACISH
jgi:hypothetical protein